MIKKLKYYLGVLPALVNHRKWLNNFKKEIENAKKLEADAVLNEELKRLKVKKEAQEVREMIREGNGQPEPVFNPVLEPKEEPEKIPKKQKDIETQLKQREDHDQAIIKIEDSARDKPKNSKPMKKRKCLLGLKLLKNTRLMN